MIPDNLHDLGILSSRLTLGHGVWLNEEDIEIAAQTGVCICHNCSSIFDFDQDRPLNSFEARGITTAIPSMRRGSADDRDMIQEMRMVIELTAPGMNEDDVPTVPQVVRMATEGGSLKPQLLEIKLEGSNSPAFLMRSWGD